MLKFLSKIYYIKSVILLYSESDYSLLAIVMENSESKNKSQTEAPTLEGLIQREWEMINELQKMLKDPELTVTERTRVATVFAFHANTLNKMLAQKGDKNQFEDQNLGDYVRDIEPRVARRFRRDFTVWQRALTSRR
jgi:hypothetical protein